MIAALWPNQLNYVPQIVSDVPATFFMVVGIALTIFIKPLAGGLFLGIAGAFRTSLIPISFLVAIMFVRKRAFRQALLLLITSLLPIALMSGYSFTRFGEQALGQNLPYGISVALASYGDNIDDTAFSAYLDDPDSNRISLTDGINLYVKALFNNTVEFVKQRMAALWAMWGIWPNVRDEVGRGILAQVVIGLRFPLLILAIYGFIMSRRERSDWILITPAILLTFIHTILFAKPRYTFPAEPLLIILAMEGLILILVKFIPLIPRMVSTKKA
jgi:hypothetical protein